VDTAKHPFKPIPTVKDFPKFLFGKTQEAITSALFETSKLSGQISVLENTINTMQALENAFIADPNQRKKYSGELERMRDSVQMAAQYALVNLAFCKGIPPLVCNHVSKNRVECAGGPQRLGAEGIPPWVYTLVAKCEGDRFLDFESVDPSATAKTIVPPRQLPSGRLMYNGSAYASLCVPCDPKTKTQPPSTSKNPFGKLLYCIANPGHPQCR
jgi:hypothetical protein